MNTVTGIPDAAWYFARLATASPNPPVRANGDSSGARCTTGAGVPSGRVSGAGGSVATVDCGGSIFFRDDRFGLLASDADEADFFARGVLRRVAGSVTSDEFSSPDVAFDAAPFSPAECPPSFDEGLGVIGDSIRSSVSGEEARSIGNDRWRGWEGARRKS